MRRGNWDFRRMGEDFERTKEDREEDETGTSRRTGRMGEDFERKKEELEDGHGTLRREKQGFREGENRTSNR